MEKLIISPIDLQLFAEGAGASGAGGGDGGTGGEGATGVTAGVPGLQTKGDKNPLADVKYGKTEEAQNANVQNQADAGIVEKDDRASKFEALIKGEYKDLYDARVQDTIQRRLKSTKEIVDKYNSISPTLETLARKYHLEDPTDMDALNKAIEDDDAYYEDEALEKGISVEQLKQIRKMEKENAELKRQMKEQSVKENADRIYADWMHQSDELKGVYPHFDLQTELQNPRFVDLLKANIDVRTAYEVMHKDEIIPAAMQFTAKAVQQKMTNQIMANGARPAENGLNSQASAVVKSDVSQLSKEDRAEIIRRVQRGERIVF